MICVLGFVVVLQGLELAACAATVTDLRCEYLKDPLGIDVTKPRLNWIITSSQRGEKQTAYQVLVASSKALLAADTGDLWDSGKVVSDQSVHVEYAGKPLASRQRCYWKVRVWTSAAVQESLSAEEPTKWSLPALWTMGLLKPEDWPAEWIGLDLEDAGSDPNDPEKRRLPARYLRREFTAEKKVSSAMAYVCGLGFFNLMINGKKVGDHVMDPLLTEYNKRACYVTFDVTQNLKDGPNAVGVVLGNGRFFAPRIKNPAPFKDYGAPRLLLQIEVEYEDGSRTRWISDDKWRVTATGPIGVNNEYDGETYDARLEMPGWDAAGFDDSKWRKVQLMAGPKGKLVAQMVEPNRVVDILKPLSVTEVNPNVWVVDFGQVFYGQPRIMVSGAAGTTVRMTEAYSLDKDGTLKIADNRNANCADVYILKGQGQETWRPRFRGQGFRRMQVTGWPGKPTADNFEGLVVNTDMDNVGQFECSNPLINKIHRNIFWDTRLYRRSGVPMDPDRDERQGWLGDPAKDSESDAYNFNVAAFYAKWLGDIRLDQREDGSIPDVSPTFWDWGKGVLWASVITILPEWYYNFYGDRRILEDNYETIRRWMLFHRERLEPDYTVKKDSYGDWCDASTMYQEEEAKGSTSIPLLSTAYYYNNCRITARLAKLLGKGEDEKLFIALAASVREGFNKRFLNLEAGTYESDTQCAYIVPLAFDLVPSEKREVVIRRLVDDIMVKNKGHLSVGLIGMQWMMQVLTQIGRSDVAYTIATQTTRPSWGYMISKGATAIWERWDSDTKGAGMNSEALLILSGNLDAWFYQTLAGINYDPEQPGFKRIIIRPQPVGDLTWVKAHHDSMYGRIVNNWKRQGDRLTMDVVIPANTTATVYVPSRDAESVTESGRPAAQAYGVKLLRVEDDNAVCELGSGSYQFGSTMKSKP
jgi:alpha-L-rhamnosidase